MCHPKLSLETPDTSMLKILSSHHLVSSVIQYLYSTISTDIFCFFSDGLVYLVSVLCDYLNPSDVYRAITPTVPATIRYKLLNGNMLKYVMDASMKKIPETRYNSG